MHIGNYFSDDRETEMMVVGWRVFNFHATIREKDMKEIPACAHCFAELTLVERL